MASLFHSLSFIGYNGQFVFKTMRQFQCFTAEMDGTEFETNEYNIVFAECFLNKTLSIAAMFCPDKKGEP